MGPGLKAYIKKPSLTVLYSFSEPDDSHRGEPSSRVQELTNEKRMPPDVTQLLVDWSGGDEQALGHLMPLVADELRHLAKRYLDREKGGHTLQPTALVHEAYLRLVDLERVALSNRLQFFAFTSRLMRNILVDHARAQQAAKRGHRMARVSLDEALGVAIREDLDILVLNDALESLRTLDEEQHRIVELRFFSGLSLDEISQITGTSLSTVSRRWASAKAWLYRELQLR